MKESITSKMFDKLIKLLLDFQNENAPDFWAVRKKKEARMKTAKLSPLFTTPSPTDSNEKKWRIPESWSNRSQKTSRQKRLQIFFKKGDLFLFKILNFIMFMNVQKSGKWLRVDSIKIRTRFLMKLILLQFLKVCTYYSSARVLALPRNP